MRSATMLVLVLVLAAACDQPDVSLGNGDDDPGAAAGPPAQDEPFVRGVILSVNKTEPVTTECVSEADPDGDGTVTDDDPPLCDPNPTNLGTIHVRGEQPEQGGETEIVASVSTSVPIVRRGDAGLEPVEFDDIIEGDDVSLWISGPVMESYPLQGSASYVLLEDT